MTPFSRNQSMQFIVLMQRTESSMWSETRTCGAKIRVAHSLTSGSNSMHRQCFASTYPSCLVDLLGNVSTSVSIIIRLLSLTQRCRIYYTAVNDIDMIRYISIREKHLHSLSRLWQELFTIQEVLLLLVNLESHGTRSVEIKGHFAFVHFTGNQFPAFFWKLHVSLPPRDYERHIQSIVDFLVMRKVDFKLPDMTFPQILFNSNWNCAYNI